MGLFAGAEYVLTNSFHGTAFSIIFGKKFKVELETVKKFNVRSRDLLNSCRLQDCILKNSEEDYSFLIAERADQMEKESVLNESRE